MRGGWNTKTNHMQEYFGHWNKLSGHARAAHQIIGELYTPDTIMHSETGQKVLSWCLRTEYFTGVVLGTSGQIGTEWIQAYNDHHAQRSQADPGNMALTVVSLSSKVQTHGLEMGRVQEGDTFATEFAQQAKRIWSEVRSCWLRMESCSSYLESLSLPFYRLLLDLRTLDIAAGLRLGQSGLISDQRWILGLVESQLQNPADACILGPTSLIIACKSLPPVEGCISSCRARLARLERLGYVFLLDYSKGRGSELTYTQLRVLARIPP